MIQHLSTDFNCLFYILRKVYVYILSEWSLPNESVRAILLASLTLQNTSSLFKGSTSINMLPSSTWKVPLDFSCSFCFSLNVCINRQETLAILFRLSLTIYTLSAFGFIVHCYYSIMVLSLTICCFSPRIYIKVVIIYINIRL